MVKKMILAWIAVLAGVSALSACTSLRVTSDVNTALLGTGQCHTYAWAGSFHGDTSLRTNIANPLNESRLRAAITAQLKAVGLQPATGSADCLVGYGIGARDVL